MITKTSYIMTTEELNALIAQAESGDVSAMNQLTHIYGEEEGFINHEQAARWFLELIKRDCDPNSGVYEQTGYNKDLYEKVKNTILNSASESGLSSLSGSSSGGSLLGGSISFTSSNAKSYISQAEELINKNIIYKEQQRREREEKERQAREKLEKFEKDYEYEDEDTLKTRWANELSNGTINIPNGVKKIGESAFDTCSGLTSIVIPDSVTSIGYHAFRNCKDLASIVIPDSVTRIEEGVFGICESLTSIIIPNSVTRIGEFAFCDCKSLTSINIPNSVTCIEDSTFMNCSGLTSIVIPDSVTSIEDTAFSGCKNLTSIVIPDSVTSIGYLAFDGSPIRSIIVPKGTKQRFSQMEGLKGLEDNIVEE